MTSFKKLTSLLPLAILLASYAAAAPVDVPNVAPGAPAPTTKLSNITSTAPAPPTGKGSTGSRRSSIIVSPLQPRAMVDEMNAVISPMQNSLDSLMTCTDSFLKSSCAPDQATSRNLKQLVQQLKQMGCDLQKNSDDLNNPDPGNPAKFESDRKAMVQRMEDFSNRHRELIAFLTGNRFSNIFGFGAAGGRGTQGTGGQSSQGGAGQTNAGGSTGGPRAGGGTQNGAGGQSAAGSPPSGNQGAAGSTQSGGQNAAGSSQAGNQSAAGSSQAGNQSAAGSSQSGGQSAAEGSQAGNQSAAGSSQGAGSGTGGNTSSTGSFLNVILSENPQDGTTKDSVTVGSVTGGNAGGTGVGPLVDVKVGTP